MLFWLEAKRADLPEAATGSVVMCLPYYLARSLDATG